MISPTRQEEGKDLNYYLMTTKWCRKIKKTCLQLSTLDFKVFVASLCSFMLTDLKCILIWRNDLRQFKWGSVAWTCLSGPGRATIHGAGFGPAVNIGFSLLIPALWGAEDGEATKINTSQWVLNKTKTQVFLLMQPWMQNWWLLFKKKTIRSVVCLKLWVMPHLWLK